MQISGHASVTESRRAYALAVDCSAIITKVPSIREARTLPCGAVIGDLHGGLTFTDAVSAALESRSVGGWQEMPTADGDVWTVIILNR